MTKLVLVLAVVVVVILVVVIVAVKNMRAEDPEEYGDQHELRSRTRDDQDERDVRYGRQRPGRQPVRASRRAGPAGPTAAGGQRGSESRSGGVGHSFDESRDQQRGRGYGHRVPEDRGWPEEAPTRARSARGRRSGDSSEWDSSEWEKLSDVDYWAELAADKPLTTTAQPAAPQPAAPYSAAPRNAAQPRQDREPETLAVRGPVPGAPRRDPATGLPVRGSQQPADSGRAAAASRNDFAAAPVPGDRAQDRKRPVTGPNGERSRQDPQRPVTGPNGERSTRRQRPPAASTGDRLPDRQRPPAAPVSEPDQRSLAALVGDRGTYLSAGPASLPLPVIRDVPRDRPRGVPDDRPRGVPDDDPLTSPSFPKIPPSDSRSYRNGRTDTPAGGSRNPSPYPEPTRQFAAYDTPAAPYPSPQRPERPAAQYPAAPYPSPQRPEHPAAQYPTAQYPSAQREHPAAQYPAAQHPSAERPEHPAPEHRAARHRGNGNGSADANRTNPHPYRPDPLTGPGPYAAGAASAPSGAASMPPAPAPVPPAASNPYGSYVTPDRQPTMASSYDGYPSMPGNGHGQSYPPPAVPGGIEQNQNGYWHQQPSAPADPSAPSDPSYLDGAAQVPDTDAHGADYPNGYGRHGQAGYLPSTYPTSQNDPAGYAPVDPYGSDGYGGYPEYGAAER
jgi:hypothetical protein